MSAAILINIAATLANLLIWKASDSDFALFCAGTNLGVAIMLFAFLIREGMA